MGRPDSWVWVADVKGHCRDTGTFCGNVSDPMGNRLPRTFTYRPLPYDGKDNVNLVATERFTPSQGIIATSLIHRGTNESRNVEPGNHTEPELGIDVDEPRCGSGPGDADERRIGTTSVSLKKPPITLSASYKTNIKHVRVPHRPSGMDENVPGPRELTRTSHRFPCVACERRCCCGCGKLWLVSVIFERCAVGGTKRYVWSGFVSASRTPKPSP